MKFKEKPERKIVKDVASIAAGYSVAQAPDECERIDRILRTAAEAHEPEKNIQINPRKRAFSEAQVTPTPKKTKIGQDLNPIIFLDTYRRAFEFEDILKYKYKKLSDGKFMYSLGFKDQYWELVEKPGKKLMKEDIARIAIDYLITQAPEKCKLIDRLLRTVEAHELEKIIKDNPRKQAFSKLLEIMDQKKRRL